MNYTEALDLAYSDTLIRRKAWPKNEFVFVRPPWSPTIETVQEVVSLPQEVKDYYATLPDQGQTMTFAHYLIKKDRHESILNGWTPTDQDKASSDWEAFTVKDK